MDRDFLQQSSNMIKSYDFLPLVLELLYGSDWFGQRLEDAWSNIDARYNSPPPISNELIARILNLFEKKAADESRLPSGAPGYYKVYWEERIGDRQMRSPAQYLFLFAGWELREVICQVYGQVISGGETKYHRLLAEYADRGPLYALNFNYDTYFEDALGNEGWFYYPDAFQRRHAIEILKPHGSLNWVHRNVGRPDEEIVVISDGAYPTASWGYGPEGFSQTSIIPMTHAKREFTPDEQSEAIRCRYGRILHRCEDVLRQAQHICIVGYSFPPGDRHFQDVLRDVRTGRVTPVISLKYIGWDGTKPEWTSKLRAIFGITFDPEVKLDGF